MRIIILLFLIILNNILNISYATEPLRLNGSVQYTPMVAKQLAFEGLDLKIDKKQLNSYLYDENNKENRNALKTNQKIAGREIMSFNSAKGLVRGYAITYESNPQYTYYYSTSGYLVCVDIDNQINTSEFPFTVGKYNPITGNLISVGFYVSETEQYVYSKNGKLKAHWIGKTAYNEKGKPIAHREYTDAIPID